MKTFETEKGNIPEGATHYCNENESTNFCWFKGVGTFDFQVMPSHAPDRWVKGVQREYINDGITTILQTKEVEWMKEVTAYTDGSSIKNGVGGYHGGAGVILMFNGKLKEISHPIPDGTNNISELTAAILALEALKESCKVNLYTDSQYVIKCMTEWLQGWKRRGWKTANKGDVKNCTLIKRLDKLCQNHDVNWIWVKGHSGDKYNDMADELACRASASLRGDR